MYMPFVFHHSLPYLGRASDWHNSKRWNLGFCLNPLQTKSQNLKMSEGISINVLGLYNARAGIPLWNWGWTSERSPKHGHRLVVKLWLTPWTFGMVIHYPVLYHNQWTKWSCIIYIDRLLISSNSVLNTFWIPNSVTV